MTGSPRRSAGLVAGLLVASFLTPLPAGAEVAAKRPPGRTLSVAVKGLPPSTAAKVRIDGPKGFQRTLRLASTKKFRSLRPGRYRLVARPVFTDGAFVARDAVKTVRVRKTRGARVVFTYRSVGVPPPPVDEAPGSVTALAVAERTATSVQLTWSNPGDADLDRIVVRRAEGSTPPDSTGAGVGVPVDGTAVAVLDASVNPKTDYAYSVFAVDRAGNRSPGTPVTTTTLGIGTVSAGAVSSCAVNGRGRAYCWGTGFLGNGTNTPSLTPVAVDTGGVLDGKILTDVSAGGNSSCVLDLEGRAYCWGSGAQGQLGTGGTADALTPVAVAPQGALAGKRLVDIVVGFRLVCALDDAGRAYCWGAGSNGQLGNGGTSDSPVPLPVTPGPRPFVSISAHQSHVCAVDTDGGAYCWGSGGDGRLGDGGTTDRLVPTPVSTAGALAGKRIVGIGAGASHTCAVDADGRAYCWGAGTSGKLGTGSATNSTVPVAVNPFSAAGQSVLTDIEAGLNHSCAVASSGRVLCWGFNGNGQVGDGTRNATNSPVIIAGGFFADKQAVAVDLGDFHSCGMESTGRVACWGFASYVGTGSAAGFDALSPLAILGIPG